MKRRQTFNLDLSVIEELEEFAKKYGISRSEVVGQVLRANLPRYAREDAFVVFRMYMAAEDT